MSRLQTLALVESATQLLNAAEWAHAAGETTSTRIVVLAPRETQTVRQLERVADVVADLGIDIRCHPVRMGGPGAVLGTARVLSDVRAAQRLVIGDPFSRFIQTLLPASTADEVVVVDDGTATWEYVSCVDAGKPLVRWQVPLRGRETRAHRATRLLSPGASLREISVFSCLREAIPVGGVGLANRYLYTRAWRTPEIVDEVDVLGTSLVDSGVVLRRAYVRAVADLAEQHGPVRYLAHRRESANLLAEIATIPGLRVARNDLPVELALREGPVGRRVVTFPSTAAHTLPLVLGDLPVSIDVRRVEPEWFAPGTTSHARRFVQRIADEAPNLPPRPNRPPRPIRPAA